MCAFMKYDEATRLIGGEDGFDADSEVESIQSLEKPFAAPE